MELKLTVPDHDVAGTELLLHLLKGRSDARRIASIQLHREQALLLCSVHVGITRGDRDLVALFREPTSDGNADTRSGADDESDRRHDLDGKEGGVDR
jgi:hypothetical protein